VSARTPLIAGNWKMYKTEREAEDYIQSLLPRVSSIDGVDVAICVPFTDLRAMVDSARGSRVEVYAQNMHQEMEGAFTGEVSSTMLEDVGVQGVVLGHSERRELFGETDRALALKVPAALTQTIGVSPAASARTRTPIASCASRSRRTSRGSRVTAWRMS
jgi:triosephosphate isomerase